MKTFDLLYQGVYLASVREPSAKVAKGRFCALTGLPEAEIKAKKSTRNLSKPKTKHAPQSTCS